MLSVLPELYIPLQKPAIPETLPIAPATLSNTDISTIPKENIAGKAVPLSSITAPDLPKGSLILEKGQ